MSGVVVVAVFRAKPGRADEVLAGLRPVIEQTHGEAGCLTYALHRDNADPDRLVLVERWTSQVALESHFQQPYMAAVGELAGELLAEPPAIHFCTPLPQGDPVKGAL
ncbi:MAG: antibiotic biosynthesis monooxygenase [Solirubrobacteraceae bacterium]|jgi:quinol monooxygenase YgiN|nr:antibiotic biosynthesis monooxygenase [Solirubrobacteraceae bacterium]